MLVTPATLDVEGGQSSSQLLTPPLDGEGSLSSVLAFDGDSSLG